MTSAAGQARKAAEIADNTFDMLVNGDALSDYALKEAAIMVAIAQVYATLAVAKRAD